MHWFRKYRLDYPSAIADPPARLRQILSGSKWRAMKYTVDREFVKIQRRPSLFGGNYWAPLFQGKFIHENQRWRLVGYFRPPWLTLAFVSFILANVLVEAAMPLLQPGETGLPGELRGGEIVEFLGIPLLIVFLAWLFGVPTARLILTAINESADINIALYPTRVAQRPAGTSSADYDSVSRAIIRLRQVLVGGFFALVIGSMALMAIGTFTEEWTSFCSIEGHWVVKFKDGHDCFAAAEDHLKKYGHAAGCRRSDWPVVVIEDVFGFIFPWSKDLDSSKSRSGPSSDCPKKCS